MPLIHPAHVVSFSSEDPNHPASNLLNRDTYRKWKCKEVGEKEAFVILKFDRAVNINCVDIGNDGSALVEVLVARSGSGEPQFEVLLSSTAFMSPLDSREGKNLCGVKSFSVNCLCKPIATQKWDLVKILVSQPFNRHVQYGLTFIKFTAAPDPNEPEKIGIFSLRKPLVGIDSDDEDDVRPGRLFSSLKSPSAGGKPKPSGSLTTSAAIREASAKLTSASKSNSEDKVKELLKKPKLDLPSPGSSGKMGNPARDNSPLMKKKDLPDPPIKSKEKEDKAKKQIAQSVARTQSSNNSSPKIDTNKSTKKRVLSPSPPLNGASSSPSTSRGATPSKKQKTARKTKPFNKLFEGVVFVMSGYENPFRGQIRDKAVEMGARYKADWDRTCTHLLCAFINTPKFRQVRSSGDGKIVKKDWIESSYRDRCRYPWRRHCVDRTDKGVESEEEIFAADDDNNEEEMMVDEDDPVENTTKKSNEEVNGNTKKKRILVVDSSEESDSNESKKAYEADTDIDDVDRTPDLSPSLLSTNDSSSAALPVFENLEFYICPYNDSTDSIKEREKLERIIVQRKGKVHKTPTNDVEYYICHNFHWDEDLTDALSDNPNLTFIHEKWIIECDKEDQLIDKDGYILLPT